jgi:hypothetical protein
VNIKPNNSTGTRCVVNTKINAQHYLCQNCH